MPAQGNTIFSGWTRQELGFDTQAAYDEFLQDSAVTEVVPEPVVTPPEIEQAAPSPVTVAEDTGTFIDPKASVGYEYDRRVPGWSLVRDITDGVSKSHLPAEALAWRARKDVLHETLDATRLTLTHVPALGLDGTLQWNKRRDTQPTAEEWAAGRRLPVANPNRDQLQRLIAEGYVGTMHPTTGVMTYRPPTTAELAARLRQDRARAVELHNAQLRKEATARIARLTASILEAEVDPVDTAWANRYFGVGNSPAPESPSYEFPSLLPANGETAEHFLQNVVHVADSFFASRPVHDKEEDYYTTTIPRTKHGTPVIIERYIRDSLPVPGIGAVEVWYERDRHETDADGEWRGDEPPFAALPRPVGIDGTPVSRTTFRAAVELYTKRQNRK